MKEIITKYNVIWIDDEFDKMSQFILDCKLNHQVNLVPFRTQRAGMEELEKHNGMQSFWMPKCLTNQTMKRQN